MSAADDTVNAALTENFIPGTIGSPSISTGRGEVPSAPAVSRYELQRDLLARSPGMRLYKYGTSWFYAEFGGNHYMFPPDLPGHPLVKHPISGKQVPADGTISVKDRWGFKKDPRTFRDAGTGALDGQSAMDAMLFFLGEYSQDGIVWLDGENDEGRKAASKSVVFRTKRRWAEEQVAARAAFLENWNRQPQNKGRLPPPPSRLQNDAQELLDELRSEGRTGAEHICEFGDYETNDWDKYARHMKVQHSKVVVDPSTIKPADPGLTLSNIERAIAESANTSAVAVTMDQVTAQAREATVAADEMVSPHALAEAAESMARDREALEADRQKQAQQQQQQQQQQKSQSPQPVKPIRR